MFLVSGGDLLGEGLDLLDDRVAAQIVLIYKIGEGVGEFGPLDVEVFALEEYLIGGVGFANIPDILI